MNYKKLCCIMLSTLVFLTLFGGFSVFASANVHNWYCVHRKDHKQPQADAQISFVEQYGGYYIDKEHGDGCKDKVIYLTFDVGYENGNVERILDAMQKEEVKGAFFVLGNVVESNTELINRMFDEGHLVCNHTFSHKPVIGKNPDEISSELERLEKLCYEKTGKKMSKYFRPPEGRFDETSLKYLYELGYKTVFWSFAYADWDNDRQMSAEKAKDIIMSNIHNGEIMLLHPTSKTNADIFEEVIKDLKSQGYRFGTLDELCRN